MRKNRICLNAVNPKIHNSLSEDGVMFSSAGAQPISLKSFRGLGDFPNKFIVDFLKEIVKEKQKNVDFHPTPGVTIKIIKMRDESRL